MRPLFRFSCVAALAVAASSSVHAQPAPAEPPADAGSGAAAPALPTPAPSAEPAQPAAAAEPAQPAAAAEPAPPPRAEPRAPAFVLPPFQIHGFVSEGGFVSTANDYIGASSQGSVEFFEAGLNVQADVADRLRAGIQIFGRDVGQFRDLPPRIDWAYLDYHWRDWLGLRAGIIKMPYGLYNEYADIDSARTAILMPQSVYPLRDRSALLAETGFSVYGHKRLGEGAGALDYQAWLGTLNVPANALEVVNATLDGIDTKYVTGAQLFWRAPLEGLRVGGTWLRTSIDFKLRLDPATTSALIMAGLVPMDYDGKLVISQRPDSLAIASAEYTRDNWLFAAEYARWYTRQISTLPDLLPTQNTKNERFYALASHRFTPEWELGGYYSVMFADADDRSGDNSKFAKPYLAWQRDAAATLRFDVNEHWLWKLEAHFIDGTADLFASQNANPERYWGLFLFKTTVTF